MPSRCCTRRVFGSRIFLKARTRSGFTLLEMLVTVAVTMIMILAVAQIGSLFGDGISTNRAVMDMAGQIRSVSSLLQGDLDAITVPMLPWVDSTANQGYFEYTEGPNRDSSYITKANSMFGDTDDVLAFTAQTRGRPYTGQYNGAPIESPQAEIIWWMGTDPQFPDNRVLYRKVLLIRPDLNSPSTGLLPGGITPANSDISMRQQGGGYAANSLSDLSRREFRYAHNTGAFPYALNATLLLPLSGNRQGEDIVQSKVLAFDVRAYDEYAPLMASSDLSLAPGDVGWTTGGTVVGRGAFVDLNYSGAAATSQNMGFSGPPTAKSKITTAATYDTWPTHYERDGADQDSQYGPDQSINGVDDDGLSGVDDDGERETSPPYPFPLRGIRVTIRLYDPGSKQVQQASVVSDFVPD